MDGNRTGASITGQALVDKFCGGRMASSLFSAINMLLVKMHWAIQAEFAITLTTASSTSTLTSPDQGRIRCLLLHGRCWLRTWRRSDVCFDAAESGDRDRCEVRQCAVAVSPGTSDWRGDSA